MYKERETESNKNHDQQHIVEFLACKTKHFRRIPEPDSNVGPLFAQAYPRGTTAVLHSLTV